MLLDRHRHDIILWTTTVMSGQNKVHQITSQICCSYHTSLFTFEERCKTIFWVAAGWNERTFDSAGLSALEPYSNSFGTTTGHAERHYRTNIRILRFGWWSQSPPFKDGSRFVSKATQFFSTAYNSLLYNLYTHKIWKSSKEKYKSYGTLNKTTCEVGVVQQCTEAQAGLVQDGLMDASMAPNRGNLLLTNLEMLTAHPVVGF